MDLINSTDYACFLDVFQEQIRVACELPHDLDLPVDAKLRAVVKNAAGITVSEFPVVVQGGFAKTPDNPNARSVKIERIR